MNGFCFHFASNPDGEPTVNRRSCLTSLLCKFGLELRKILKEFKLFISFSYLYSYFNLQSQAHPRAFAFGGKVAMVYTTPLNKRATCASALPTANSLWLGSHRGPRYRGSETDIITSNIYRSMTNNYFFSKRLSSVMCVLSTMTREWFEIGSVYSRLSLGSHLSRFSLASLICLCMLTVGVENAWGEAIYSNTGATGTTNGVTADGSVSTYIGNKAPSFANTSSSDRTFITITGLNVSGYTDVQLKFDYRLTKSGSNYSSFTVKQYKSSGDLIGSTTNVTTGTNNTFSSKTIDIESNCVKIVFYGSPVSTRFGDYYGNYVDNISITGTAVASCGSDPTVGVASLKGSVSRN